MDHTRDESADAAQKRRPDGKKNGEDAPLLAGSSFNNPTGGSESSEDTPLLVGGSSEEDEEYMKPVDYHEWDHLPWYKRPSVCFGAWLYLEET
jgi:hypothetical protein